MSEIKITKNSIENGIISNGQVTVGSIDNTDFGNSNIVSNSSGSMAVGYIDSTTVSNTGASISATGLGSFASGYAYVYSTSSENGEILEYHNVIANGDGAHAEGCGTYAGELYAHAEGYDTSANGDGTHAEGCNTYAGMQLINTGANATGLYNDTSNAIILNEGIAEQLLLERVFINNHIYNVAQTVSDSDNVIIFDKNISNEDLEWAKNNFILRIANAGVYAHAEGYETNATGNYSHAEGWSTTASGQASHAGGKGTIANREAMTAIGKYNQNTNTANTLFVVGDGTNNTDRSDAFRVNSLGSETGDNLVPSSVQAKVNGVSDVYLGCPIGTVVMWAGPIVGPVNTLPYGWMTCLGQKIEISPSTSDEYDWAYSWGGGTAYYKIKNQYLEYKNLLYVIRTAYGSEGQGPDNLTAVFLPNFQQKFPLGAQYQGTIGINNLDHRNGWSTTIGSGSKSTAGEAIHRLTWEEMTAHSHQLQEITESIGLKEGGNYEIGNLQDAGIPSAYHNNIPPFLAINFIIKYK